MNKEKFKIIYIGLHPNTLIFLSNDPSHVMVGASFLEYFFTFKTINPLNYIFKLVYYLRVNNKLRWLEVFSVNLFYLFSFATSSVAYKYRDYMKVLSDKNIQVLDVENIDELSAYILMNSIDLIVVNSWGMLPGKIIFSPKHKTINLHPSILPQYKGALPTLWALKNKDRESAVTYMILDESMDGGGVLSQNKFKIDQYDNALMIEDKIEKIIKKTLNNDVEKYLNGQLAPYSQDMSGGSRTAKYQDYRLIEWEKEQAEDIYNKIILYPFVEPGVYCFSNWQGRRIEIKDAKFFNDHELLHLAPGKIYASCFHLFIGTKSGIIKIRLFIDVSFRDSFLFLLQGRTFKICKKRQLATESHQYIRKIRRLLSRWFAVFRSAPSTLISWRKKTWKEGRKEGRKEGILVPDGFTTEYLQDILRLERECFPATWQYPTAEKYYASMLKDKEIVNVFLLCHSGQTIGYALAKPLNAAAPELQEYDPAICADAEKFYIETIQILPGFQGKGGARILLTTICREALKRGVFKFAIHARTTNSFHEKIKKIFHGSIILTRNIEKWKWAQEEPYQYIEWEYSLKDR